MRRRRRKAEALLLVVLSTSFTRSTFAYSPDPRNMSLISANSRHGGQTLFFHDRKTNVPIHIIGTMHYNPHSIAKVEDIINTYGKGGRLGSVVLESCEERWTKTQQVQPQGSAMRNLLDNEFQSAAELAKLYTEESQEETIRVLLADENIESNNQRVNEAFKSTVRDLLNPWKGGWEAISSDLKRGYSENFDPSSLSASKKGVEYDHSYLDRNDLFDSDMLKSAPTSLVRYVLGFVAKKPIPGSLLLAWLTALLGYGLIHGTGDLTFADEAKATAAGLLLNLVLGVPLLGRVLLVTLLADRNQILANNIRAECEKLQAEGRNDQVCVVVLGLAHCNGVKRLLCE